MALQDLSGQVAWITGAGTGIGEGAARSLAAAGMHVVLSGRRKEKLAGVAADLGANASIEELDVADRDSVSRVAERIIKQHGKLDVLVASAGINIKERNWHNVSLDDWDQVIRIDLDGAFYCSKAVLPQMIEQGGGLIINISSWAGKHVSVVTGPAYTAAKHAMNAMNESINMEAGLYGVRACAICPGEVATPILDNRPVPVSLPPHVCINELTVSPTWNRGYVAQAKGLASNAALAP